VGRVADVVAAEHLVGEASDGNDRATAHKRLEERQSGLDLRAQRAPVHALGPGMRGDDVPEEDAVGDPELREHALDDRRGRLAGPAAGQLPLRRERQTRDPRAAVAGSLADDEERSVAAGAQIGEQAPAEQRGTLAVTVEVERLADPGSSELADEFGVIEFESRRSGHDADVLDVRTLTDGGQPAVDIAHAIADFLGQARRSLDIAQYDFHLEDETRAVVARAIEDAGQRGVAVRILYNVDHRNPIPVPPPPEPDVALMQSLGVPSRGIAGVPDLMHHKYVVRDREAVWTGSMNWTDDSWSRQENVIVTVDSAEIADAYARNFEELWAKGDVERSGFVDPARLTLDGRQLRTWFTPGHGEALAHNIAKAIGRARRVRICSPVITAAPVLATLAELVSERKVDVAGCVDQPQVQGVVLQWRANGNAAWKLPLLERVMEGPFSGKRSHPWQPGPGVHDFMHAKITVADDVVFTGSFNLSRSGEMNAENMLEIHDQALADRLAAYVDEVRHRYPPFSLDGEGDRLAR
jgi:phosphatidylserine/phosphatidylglycerophosphate/cardiolipin synthase-like enzyme